ncbi:MAG: ATP-binding protein [Mariniphaga sp.]|nr:ATP-binding protein [Mariniphaga sp.]MDD4224975.1 ATP-binding protein [Mariniphaga sp.]MDD4424622.1 ATP-binding protein [Mariniphaga sp.]
MATKGELHKRLIIKNNISELERLVAFLESLQNEWNIPASTIPSINLALEEALTNVIFYAFENDDEQEIKLDFKLNNNQLTMIISDNGKPYDPTTKTDPDINLSVKDRPVGGLGIFLIKQLMDEVSYQRKGNLNQLTLMIQIG